MSNSASERRGGNGDSDICYLHLINLQLSNIICIIAFVIAFVIAFIICVIAFVAAVHRLQ